MRSGEVWWADLPRPRGSGPGRRRPVVVVSADAFNQSRIRTVIVAAITSNEQLARAPGNIRLTRSQSGLSRVSVINVSQLLTLDRSVLSERVKTLPADIRSKLDAGLLKVLDLT